MRTPNLGARQDQKDAIMRSSCFSMCVLLELFSIKTHIQTGEAMGYPSQEEVLQDIKPLTIEMQEVFEESIALTDASISRDFALAADGYLRSTLTRMHAKERLMQLGYDLARVANMGIEIRYLDKYSLKVMRSSHRGNVPAPHSLHRAAWYATGVQPPLCPADGDADAFWGIKRLNLRGAEVDGAIARALATQNDGLIHLVIDWEEQRGVGVVRMAVSMPDGVWAEGEEPRVLWRSVLERDEDGLSRFVQSDEDINFFDDDNDDGLGVAAI